VVIDDYAHHPAELIATFAAARERGPRRIVAVFQPHLYSRTKALCRETGEALAGADVAFVTDIYAAREPFDPTISASDVVHAVPGGRARLTPTLADARQAVLDIAQPGDMILTLGAGDITVLGQELVAALERRV
jgi:UDP-N-acetylmuramate--alanine ligase